MLIIASPLLALIQDQTDKLRQVPRAKPLLLSEELDYTSLKMIALIINPPVQSIILL